MKPQHVSTASVQSIMSQHQVTASGHSIIPQQHAKVKNEATLQAGWGLLGLGVDDVRYASCQMWWQNKQRCSSSMGTCRATCTPPPEPCTLPSWAFCRYSLCHALAQPVSQDLVFTELFYAYLTTGWGVSHVFRACPTRPGATKGV